MGRSRRRKHSSFRRSRNSGFSIFNWIELPFVIIAVVALLFSIYLMFTSFFVGVAIPSMIAIAISWKLIKTFNKSEEGWIQLYHTLALSSVFLLIIIFLFFKAFILPFDDILPDKTTSTSRNNQEYVRESIETRIVPDKEESDENCKNRCITYCSSINREFNSGYYEGGFNCLCDCGGSKFRTDY